MAYYNNQFIDSRYFKHDTVVETSFKQAKQLFKQYNENLLSSDDFMTQLKALVERDYTETGKKAITKFVIKPMKKAFKNNTPPNTSLQSSGSFLWSFEYCDED